MFPIKVKWSTSAGFQVIFVYLKTMKQAAKSTLEFEIVTFKNSFCRLQIFIKLHMNSLWQIFWDFCDNSILN